MATALDNNDPSFIKLVRPRFIDQSGGTTTAISMWKADPSWEDPTIIVEEAISNADTFRTSNTDAINNPDIEFVETASISYVDNAILEASTSGSSGPADTDDLAEGSTNLYYTEARVSANTDVTANTAKISADGSIDTHSDVDTSASTSGSYLSYNGSSWVAEYAATHLGAAYVVDGTISHTPALYDPLKPYNNIQTAITAAALVATAANRIKIEILPGSYSLSLPLGMEDYVDLYFHEGTFVSATTNVFSWNSTDANVYGHGVFNTSSFFTPNTLSATADTMIQCKSVTLTQSIDFTGLSTSTSSKLTLDVSEKIDQTATGEEIIVIDIASGPKYLYDIHVKCPTIIKSTAGTLSLIDIQVDDFSNNPNIRFDCDIIDARLGGTAVYIDSIATSSNRPVITFNVKHIISNRWAMYGICDTTAGAEIKARFVGTRFESTNAAGTYEAVALNSVGTLTYTMTLIFDNCIMIIPNPSNDAFKVTSFYSTVVNIVSYTTTYINGTITGVGTFNEIGATIVQDSSLE
jgi:hypothetical protein